MITWGPMCWRHLDAAQAQQLWDELIDWVEWLRHRYGLSHSKLPACWPFHPVAVEELTALMAAYTAAYQALSTKDGAVVRYHDQMIVWHRMELWPCLARIHEYADTTCTTKECKARPRPMEPLDYRRVNEFVAEDLRLRRIDNDADVMPESVMSRLVSDGVAVTVDDGVKFDDSLWEFNSDRSQFHRRGDDQ